MNSKSLLKFNTYNNSNTLNIPETFNELYDDWDNYVRCDERFCFETVSVKDYLYGQEDLTVFGTELTVDVKKDVFFVKVVEKYWKTILKKLNQYYLRRFKKMM